MKEGKNKGVEKDFEPTRGRTRKRLIINKLGYFHNVTFFACFVVFVGGGRPLFGYSQGLIHFSQKFLFFFIFYFFVVMLFVYLFVIIHFLCLYWLIMR